MASRARSQVEVFRALFAHSDSFWISERNRGTYAGIVENAMYAGVLIDELIKQVEQVEQQLLLNMLTVESGRRVTAKPDGMASDNLARDWIVKPMAANGLKKAARNRT